jgi:asparagine synthase (glutamine-hydrolysing)
MCGIWLTISENDYYEQFKKIAHRGPDMSIYQKIDNIAIGFHRLAILQPNFNASQPYMYNNKILICNGEIYNFKELIYKYQLSIFNKADCLTILHLYEKLKFEEFINIFKNKEIIGEFAFIIIEFDNNQKFNKLIACRDAIGVRPLYYSIYNDEIRFSSEIKGIVNSKSQEFPPGNIFIYNADKTNEFIDFKTIYNTQQIYDKSEEYYLERIRTTVINSVNRRLISDKPISFLLSGGVDSSIIAAIASRILNKPINTFCCGMNDGTDLIYAKKVAKFINSNHTEVIFTPEEALNSIEQVIYTTETWDVTTIRASVGQFLVSKYINKNTDTKVVLVGEGPDEVCSSYMFNYYAPDGNSLHEAAKEYVEKIHIFDGRRADRCISYWGLEARVPYLDLEFIEAYWEIPAELRHPKYKGIEKWWLRKAFEGYLPDEVLWRKKDAFSDAISSSKKRWYEIIQDSIFTPPYTNADTAEKEYYIKIFNKYFSEDNSNIIPHYWQPKWISKNNEFINPSATILDVYN